jgi:hypothetical protein
MPVKENDMAVDLQGKYSTLDIALDLAARGVPIFPCNLDKTPATPHGFKDATTDPARIGEWWTKNPAALLAMPTGEISGVDVIDEDPRNGGDLDMLGPLPMLVVAQSRSGGRHIFTKHRRGNRSGKLADGIDLKSDGGYVILWGYSDQGQWIRGDLLTKLPEFPEQVRPKRLMLKHEPFDTAAALKGVPEGQRDTTLFKLACKLRAADVPQDQAETLVLEAAANCDPPFPEQDAVKKLENAYSKYEPNTVKPAVEPDAGFTAADLAAMQFPPQRWAVPNLLPEGLTMLAGKAKMGKSWMGLGVALAIATGGKAFGTVDVDQGEVLYLALEDKPRRLQDRLLKMLRVAPPRTLYFHTQWPRLGAGGEDRLREWIESHPEARLIVIDTLKMIKPETKGNRNAYDVDYESVRPLIEITNQYNIAILVIHHMRKAEADDPIDEISGSIGLSAGVDGLMVLRRERGAADAFLYVDGRVGLTRLHGPIRVKRSGSVKGVEDGKEGQALLA